MLICGCTQRCADKPANDPITAALSQPRDASERSSQHVLKGQKSSQPEIGKTTFVSKRPFCKLLKEKQNGGILVCITCIDLTAPFLHGIVQTLINEVRAKHCGIASHFNVCHCLELSHLTRGLSGAKHPL